MGCGNTLKYLTWPRIRAMRSQKMPRTMSVWVGSAALQGNHSAHKPRPELSTMGYTRWRNTPPRPRRLWSKWTGAKRHHPFPDLHQSANKAKVIPLYVSARNTRQTSMPKLERGSVPFTKILPTTSMTSPLAPMPPIPSSTKAASNVPCAVPEFSKASRQHFLNNV